MRTTGAFTSPDRRVTLYAPSIFGPWGEPVFSDGVPTAFPNSLQQALEAAFAARSAARVTVDQFVRIAAIAFGADKAGPLEIEAHLRSEKLINEFMAVNTLLDEFNLLSSGARPGSEPSAMEMMTRAAALLDELQRQRPGLPTYYLAVSVESAGGTHRIAHNLLNSLAGSDGISLRAGVVLSYALFNSSGVVVTAGLVPQRSAFEPVSAAAPLRTWIAVIGVVFASILAAAVSLRLSAKLVP